MRVIVTGAGGLVGGRMAEVLQRRGFDVLASYRRALPPPGPRPIRLELDDSAALARTIDRERPQAIVHSAALSRVDLCRERPDFARLMNTEVPRRLASLCRQRGLQLVAISTDLAFSGERPWLREDDAAQPLSVYGRTKLDGEEAVLAEHPAAVVARLALVAGRGHGARGTASESVAWALGNGRTVTLFTDEYRTPVDPDSAADAIVRLLAHNAAGRFHLGGTERVSRYELGLRLARVLGLPETGIIPSLQADHPAPEPRPADVSLDSTRARRELGWMPRPLDEALRESRLSASDP